MSHERLEFENDRVRVVRVTVDAREKHSGRNRDDRVLVWLTDSHHTRATPIGTHELRRKAGEVAWRPASQHQIENHGDERTEILIVELKEATAK
jgi:hypothetical protein